MLLFLGHLIFEMSAGYELKQLAPGKDDYKTVHKSVKPVLEHIFDDELSHSISDVRKLVISYIKFHTHFFFLFEYNFASLQIKDHSFFDVLLPELKDFKPAEVS